jgi:metallo-beta-lactamase class B
LTHARLAAVAVFALGAGRLQAGTPPADAAARAAWTSTCRDWDDWNKAGPPFRVHGNTYYVGTCGITSLLIVGDHGDILIDGGPADAADLIAANIRRLGFKPGDVKILLHSHEHHDHVGGMARLKQLTGAKLYASPFAAKALARGSPNPEDPQFELHNTFPATSVDQVLVGDPKVVLGALELDGIATPGHTPGALSWHWRSCEGSVCKAMVYADSLTSVSGDAYRFSDHPAYLVQFRNSLDRVAALECDILLSPHPAAGGMRAKLLAGGLGGPPLCRDYAAGLRKRCGGSRTNPPVVRAQLNTQPSRRNTLSRTNAPSAEEPEVRHAITPSGRSSRASVLPIPTAAHTATGNCRWAICSAVAVDRQRSVSGPVSSVKPLPARSIVEQCASSHACARRVPGRPLGRSGASMSGASPASAMTADDR